MIKLKNYIKYKKINILLDISSNSWMILHRFVYKNFEFFTLILFFLNIFNFLKILAQLSKIKFEHYSGISS